LISCAHTGHGNPVEPSSASVALQEVHRSLAVIVALLLLPSLACRGLPWGWLL